jgi:hypothetical protein
MLVSRFFMDESYIPKSQRMLKANLTPVGGKRLVKAPKVYVRDSGIAHALLGIRGKEALLGHPVGKNEILGLASFCFAYHKK